MDNKQLRNRINRIREAQTIITEEINLLYNEISEHLEECDKLQAENERLRNLLTKTLTQLVYEHNKNKKLKGKQ